jgi:hypothetical protein
MLAPATMPAIPHTEAALAIYDRMAGLLGQYAGSGTAAERGDARSNARMPALGMPIR